MNTDIVKETALSESIAHWRRYADGDLSEGEPGAHNCALCYLYQPDCVGCHVSEATEQSDCQGTPFYLAREAYRRYASESIYYKRYLGFMKGSEIQLSRFKKLSAAMVTFLEGLR
mgnify:CR=1 FL=1|jgi:hypothetical protein